MKPPLDKKKLKIKKDKKKTIYLKYKKIRIRRPFERVLAICGIEILGFLSKKHFISM
jgi:hypothetical protein